MNRLLFGALAAAILSTAWIFLPDPTLQTASYSAIKLGALGLIIPAIAVALAFLPAARIERLDLLLGAAFGLSMISLAVEGRNFEAGAAVLALDLAGWFCFVGAARLDLRQREAMVRVVVIAAGGIALLALIEMLGVRLPWASIRRPVSAIGHRNFVAAYLAISFPLAVRETIYGSRKILGGIVSGLCLIVVVAARCRSAWLGLAVAALPMLWIAAGSLRGTRVRAIAPLALGSLAVVALLSTASFPGLEWRGPAPFSASWRGLFDWERGSASRRFDHYRIAAAAAGDHFWLGVGPHQWSPAVARYAHVVPGGQAQPFTGELTPNSELARRIAELGVPAVLCSVAAFVLLIAGASRGLRDTEKSRRAWTIAGLAALAAAAINALADAPLYRPESMVLIAVVAGIARPPLERFERPAGPIVRAAEIAAGVAVAASAVLQAGAAVIILVFGMAGTPWSLRWYANPRGVEQYARALATAGRCDDAEPWLRRARRWAPERTGIIALEADCLARAGRVEEAAALQREVERLEAAPR